MAWNLGETLRRIGFGSSEAKDARIATPAIAGSGAEKNKPKVDTGSSLAQVLLGPIGAVGDYHFPADLIGGCCPRVIGEEEDIVWHAAAEACDTERVHLIWQSQGDRIWYLAVRSQTMASFPNTWCPFGSLLPGLPDAVPPPVCYTFYSDEAATMVTVLVDGLQIYRGTSSVVRAKAERISREVAGIRVVELIPDIIEKLTPVPWYSLSLFEDRARRVLAVVSVAAAMVLASLAVFIWLGAAMRTLSAHSDMTDISQRAASKSTQMLNIVQGMRASPMREQLARFADLNDGLLNINGFLEIYLINNNKVSWRATVPSNITSDRITELGAQTLDSNERGVVIGSSKDAINAGMGKR